jgi:tetrahydromethanopterin S-methyltransferase subunit G
MSNDPTEDLPDGDKRNTGATIADLFRRFNEVNDNLTTRIDNMQKVMLDEFAAVNTRLDEVSRRLITVESSLDAIERDMKTLNRLFDKSVARIARTETELEMLGERVDDLESKTS